LFTFFGQYHIITASVET